MVNRNRIQTTGECYLQTDAGHYPYHGILFYINFRIKSNLFLNSKVFSLRTIAIKSSDIRDENKCIEKRLTLKTIVYFNDYAIIEAALNFCCLTIP